jgi:putative endonuclease|tara:strand:+ start:268 stop:528 length:261 start_codon:yes stop_codon:yes gene_type:complete
MHHYVYMLISVNRVKLITYVGYSVNPLKRLKLHNQGKGAKFTKGRKWKIIFKKKLNNKSEALKFEYFLKKNIKIRNNIKNKYINEH